MFALLLIEEVGVGGVSNSADESSPKLELSTESEFEDLAGKTNKNTIPKTSKPKPIIRQTKILFFIITPYPISFHASHAAASCLTKPPGVEDDDDPITIPRAPIVAPLL